MLVKLSEIIPGWVDYTDNEERSEDSCICLVIINVDCIDVYDENGHVEEMEEATHHMDLQSEFVPLEVNDIVNGVGAE